MCGIVGYIGEKNAKDIVLNGLKKLEYRGYDSAGMSLWDNKTSDHTLIKVKGRIDALEKRIDIKESPLAIGHTRWATHGKVNQENAHPHTSFSGRFIVVHNGVIDNYKQLKKTYLNDKTFTSETDTEVIAFLIDYFVSESLPADKAILKTLRLLEGSYALLVIDRTQPDLIYAAKHKSPLLMGKSNQGIIIASDMMALLPTADQYVALEDETFVTIHQDAFTIFDLNGTVQPYQMQPIDMDDMSSEKGAFDHFMLKEIHEQPAVIRKILNKYFEKNDVLLDTAMLDTIKKHDRIHILAAGTSMHAGLVAKKLLEQWAGMPTEVHIASEFAYDMPLLNGKPFFIMISQSGETADLRACLMRLKKDHHTVMTVTNVRTSTLAREADMVLTIHAGPEIAVASTKAYTAQIAVLAILSYALSHQSFDLKAELSKIASAMDSLLEKHEDFKPIVESLLNKRHCFYIGRGLDYAVALEAALKLKEISYIQTEGFASGELKHGTIALIEEDTPVIALISQNSTASLTRSNLNEVKSRGAKTLSIVVESLRENGETMLIPDANPSLAPLLMVIPTQLIAYYAALVKGYDIDKPRNLAKSVTVE